MVAFGTATIIGILFCVGIVAYGKRREPGQPLTWGEAMAAAGFGFLVMFWWYGVIPHQWLAWADNELRWRSDEFLIKPTAYFPITITKVVARDTLVVVIYGVGLVLQVALWAHWQGRGKAKPAELPTSRYGRPLVKQS